MTENKSVALEPITTFEDERSHTTVVLGTTRNCFMKIGLRQNAFFKAYNFYERLSVLRLSISQSSSLGREITFVVAI
jgi:hypothetical protein